MAKNYGTISNNDLYEKYPQAHDAALEEFRDTVTDETYPRVEAWEIRRGTAYVENERVEDYPIAIARPIFAGDGNA